MADLKPCPFCGGEAERDGRRAYIPFGVGRGITYTSSVVYCTGCGAELVHETEDTSNLTEDECDYVQEELISAWNTRPAPDDLVEAVEPFRKYGEVLLSRFPKNHGFDLEVGTNHEVRIVPADFQRLIDAIKANGGAQ